MIAMERKGFTLIEILIVVAIIAILASIVLVGLGPTQQAGRDARRLSDLHEVQNGLELYYNSCGYYPGGDTKTPCAGYTASGGNKGYETLRTTLVGFSALGIGSVPDDPTAGQHYLYATTVTGSSYILEAKLENGGNSVFTSYTPPVFAGYTDGDGVVSTGCTTPYYCITL
jgi:prepilin-type N-terminal cleavage/methylation domain-containing protein